MLRNQAQLRLARIHKLSRESLEDQRVLYCAKLNDD
jgi:hypothetical protein